MNFTFFEYSKEVGFKLYSKDSKKFEFQNFNSTIRFFIKNKLEFKKMRSRDRRIFEKNQFTISKL